jgi:hypothetical protein
MRLSHCLDSKELTALSKLKEQLITNELNGPSRINIILNEREKKANILFEKKMREACLKAIASAMDLLSKQNFSYILKQQ